MCTTVMKGNGLKWPKICDSSKCVFIGTLYPVSVMTDLAKYNMCNYSKISKMHIFSLFN